MVKMLEYEYFSPYESSQDIWKGRAPKDCSPEERAQVLHNNILYLSWADVLLCRVGGMDDSMFSAERRLSDAVRHFLDEPSDSSQPPPYHYSELMRALDAVNKRKPAPTDIGVGWEMGHFNALGLAGRDLKDSGIEAPQKFTLAYVDPTDKSQNMNLMLAGTVDAVAYGPAQLHRALEMLRQVREDSPRRRVESVREKFHPDKHIVHEEEPIR